MEAQKINLADRRAEHAASCRAAAGNILLHVRRILDELSALRTTAEESATWTGTGVYRLQYCADKVQAAVETVAGIAGLVADGDPTALAAYCNPIDAEAF